MAYEDYNSIRLLKNLFDQCKVNKGDSSDSDAEGDFPGTSSALGPASIKPKKSEVKKTLENPLMIKIDPEPSINSMEELERQQELDQELLDTRKQPEFSIAYKQALTTSDIYLQMGMKTSATASCENMVIEIKLPEETVTIDQMDLKVEPADIRLETPVYKFSLNLPHSVDPKRSRAEYDVDTKVLKLTLKMNRELDFINF